MSIERGNKVKIRREKRELVPVNYLTRLSRSLLATHQHIHYSCSSAITILSLTFSLINSWLRGEKQESENWSLSIPSLTFKFVSGFDSQDVNEGWHSLVATEAQIFWLEAFNSPAAPQCSHQLSPRKLCSSARFIDTIHASESCCLRAQVCFLAHFNLIECVSSAGRHQAGDWTKLTSNYISEYKAIIINFNILYGWFMLSRAVFDSPNGSSYNDDDHAYRIGLIKWQWGSFDYMSPPKAKRMISNWEQSLKSFFASCFFVCWDFAHVNRIEFHCQIILGSLHISSFVFLCW